MIKYSYTLILFILLSTSLIQTHDASNSQTAPGAVLFAASIGMTIACQKLKTKRTDESQELAKNAIKTNHTQFNLPQQPLPNKDEIFFRNGYSSPILKDPGVFSLDNKIHTLKKPQSPLLLTYTPEWDEAQKKELKYINDLFYGRLAQTIPNSMQNKEFPIVISKENYEILLANQEKKLKSPRSIKYTNELHEQRFQQESLNAPKAELLRSFLSTDVLNEIKSPKLSARKEALKIQKETRNNQLGALKKVYQLYNRPGNINLILATLENHIMIDTFDIKNEAAFNPTADQSLKQSTHIYLEHKYTPKNSATKKIIYLPVFHGTTLSPYTGKFNDEMIKSAEAYAQRIALEQNAIVHLQFIRWSGNLEETKRQKAGQDVAQIIQINIDYAKEQCPDTEISVYGIAHSHGGNVLYHLAQQLEKSNTTINKAIVMATPQPDIKIPANIQELTVLYGTGDFTGTVGSILATNGQNSSLRIEEELLANPTTTKVTNISLNINGAPTTHKSIKCTKNSSDTTTAIDLLPLLEEYAKEFYFSQKELSFNVNTLETEYEILGVINEQYTAGLTEENNDLIHFNDQNKRKFKNEYPCQPTLGSEQTLCKKLISEMKSNGYSQYIIQPLELLNKTQEFITSYMTDFSQNSLPIDDTTKQTLSTNLAEITEVNELDDWKK